MHVFMRHAAGRKWEDGWTVRVKYRTGGNTAGAKDKVPMRGRAGGADAAGPGCRGTRNSDPELTARTAAHVCALRASADDMVPDV